MATAAGSEEQLARILALNEACLAPGPGLGWGSLQELPLQAEPVCTALNLYRALRLAPHRSQVWLLWLSDSLRVVALNHA